MNFLIWLTNILNKSFMFQQLSLRFLAHLSRRLTKWAYSIPVPWSPSVVVVRSSVHKFKHLLRPNHDQSKQNIVLTWIWNGGWKFIRGTWSTWPRWLQRSIHVAKTKALISCAVTAQMICGFVSHKQKFGFLRTKLIYLLKPFKNLLRKQWNDFQAHHSLFKWCHWVDTDLFCDKIK